jgi:hypothetical protein
VYTARGLQRLVYSFIAGLTSVTVPEFEYGEAVSELRATCLNAALGAVRLHAKNVHSLFIGDALTQMQPPSLEYEKNKRQCLEWIKTVVTANRNTLRTLDGSLVEVLTDEPLTTELASILSNCPRLRDVRNYTLCDKRAMETIVKNCRELQSLEIDSARNASMNALLNLGMVPSDAALH